MDLNLTEQGFLVNSADWNETIAIQLASLNNTVLTPAHWELVLFMRSYYEKYHYLPNSRIFIKAIASQFGTDKGNSRYLQHLFSESPLKQVCLIAGLSNPPSCL